MWDMFFVAIFVGAIIVFIPGFLLLRAARLTSVESLLAAPAITIALLSIMAIIWAKIGISFSLTSAVVPLVIFAAAALVVSQLIFRKRIFSMSSARPTTQKTQSSVWMSDWVLVVLYLVVAVAISMYVFVKTLDGPCSFLQEIDNAHHLGLIRSFADTGNFSSLAVTIYPADSLGNADIPVTSSFYPAAWHCIAALLVSTLDVSVTLATNATNFIFSSLVFPLSMLLLLKVLFPNNRKIVLCGIICSMVFVAFPWGFIKFGPLYPNLAAYALVPSLAAAFIALLQRMRKMKTRILLGCFFAIGMVGVALAQPNAIFVLMVFLVPYCVDRIARWPIMPKATPQKRATVRIAVIVLFLILAALIWIFFYKASFMQNIVSFTWPSMVSKTQALINALTLAYVESNVQLLLAATVLIGAAYTLYRRRYLWLSCSYAAMCFLYALSIATDGHLKTFLTGFWYTDPYRLAAAAAIFAIPLACMGLYVLIRLIIALAQKASSRARGLSAKQAGAVSVVSAALFLLIVMFPSYVVPGLFTVNTGFGGLRDFLVQANDQTMRRAYGFEEELFVEEVKELTGNKDIVINEGPDGSAFAYGVNGLNVYYRAFFSEGAGTPIDGMILRTKLNQIATDTQVQEIVRKLQAEYVLVLDQKSSAVAESSGSYLWNAYFAGEWIGIESINESTPGFEVVLSRGDMRLYRITAV